MSVPFLKKEAVISIKIGSAYVKQLSDVITSIVEGKSEEDLERAKKAFETKSTLEPWMMQVSVLQTLIRAIYEQAEKEGMVEYREMDTIVSDSLHLDQSPE